MLSSLSLLFFCTSLVSPALVQDQFENFKREFNKNYDEVEEVSKFKTSFLGWLENTYIEFSMVYFLISLFQSLTKYQFLKAYRMSVFESNMKIINEHNKGYKDGKYSWYMGINKFTDLTPEEFNRLNNLRMPEVSKRDFVYEMKAKKLQKLLIGGKR